MAEIAVANKVVGEVVGPFLTKLKREIGYAWNCKKNVKKLRREAEKLENMKERVEQKIKPALENGDVLLAGVEKWVEEALAHISTTEDFLQEEAIAKKTCFKLRMCVNPDTHRRYGKHAVEKVAFLEQHQKDGAAFEGEISIPTPAPGILEIAPRKNYDELVTRNSLLEKIIKSVKDESKQITGIYGIGGVGKSTLAKEVGARVKDLFALVVFVDVKRHVDAASIKTQVEIAAKRIDKGQKVLIILDDVWSKLKLHDVGIPCGTRYPTCKILLTSRNRSVCTEMNAHTIIYIESLPIEEAWVLFKRVVGERVETDAKLKEVASKVVEGCGGLPLILQAVGKALKDKEKFEEWEKALDKIKKHATSDIDPAIRSEFAHLKLSYDYLESEEAKSIFLLCSMFPEDYNIPFERLAYYWVGLHVHEDLNSTLEDARNKVQDAVKILESSCLLLDGFNESSTKMHGVVREVALLIASKDDNIYLVESGKNLTEWEPRIRSLGSCTGISLMTNDICKLPGYELNIPLLKIFLMQGNHRLSEISDKFTKAIKEAEVIDFEYTNMSSLPESLNQLTRLRMLNLGGNYKLNDICILGKLEQLEILILSDTGITKIPKEIENLVNLRLFRADRCTGLSHIVPGVLSKLCWLEELSIDYYYYPMEEGHYNSLEEIGKLSKLTFLSLYVRDICLFPKGDYLNRLKRFTIQIGEHIANRIPTGNRTLILDTPNLDISNLMLVRKLIKVCNGICLASIEKVDNIMPMMYCEGSETHEGVKENTKFLLEVKELRLKGLSSFRVIWNCPDQYISLNNLVRCEIHVCPKLEKLFTVSVAQGLFNLQNLIIRDCERLKEVISDGDEETSTGGIHMVVPAKNIGFPRLAEISLMSLDNLKSFYPGNATIKFPSLVKVGIWECDIMEKWSYDTPNLQLVNEIKANGSTIDEMLADFREAYYSEGEEY